MAETIQEVLGEVPDIAGVRPDSKTDIFSTAFDLYRDTVGVVTAIANIYTAETAHDPLPRGQAILVGLLMRIAKFMTAVMQLSDGQRDKGEVILALNRSIMESVVNLKVLIAKDDPRVFSQFVEFSLGPERELYDAIQQNIGQRGSTLPIEERMIRSIDRICRLSGVAIDQVRAKYGDWGGGLKERLKAVGLEDGYVHFQRVPSHAVHGSWVDLLLHFLDESGNGFKPRSRPTSTDPRLWLPTALLVLDSTQEYLAKYFRNFDELALFMRRIEILRDRVVQLDKIHEDWMSSTELSAE